MDCLYRVIINVSDDKGIFYNTGHTYGDISFIHVVVWIAVFT